MNFLDTTAKICGLRAEEERILAGGRDFFVRHSPLIMFEIKADEAIKEKLRAAFSTIDYQLFRLLVGGSPRSPASA